MAPDILFVPVTDPERRKVLLPARVCDPDRAVLVRDVERDGESPYLRDICVEYMAEPGSQFNTVSLGADRTRPELLKDFLRVSAAKLLDSFVVPGTAFEMSIPIALRVL